MIPKFFPTQQSIGERCCFFNLSWPNQINFVETCLKFKDLKKNDLENALFEEYKKLDKRSSDETHLRSWFKDQVLHPKETQHTLAEILPIIKTKYK